MKLYCDRLQPKGAEVSGAQIFQIIASLRGISGRFLHFGTSEFESYSDNQAVRSLVKTPELSQKVRDTGAICSALSLWKMYSA